MKKYILSVFVVAVIGIAGCDIATPPTCITGTEMCELSRLDTGTGIYQVCGEEGEWGDEFVCGAGCVDNRCASNSPIPFCETENEIKCVEQKDISIAIQCMHGRWIPDVCDSGVCTPGKGCTGAGRKCEAADSDCISIESIGSLQAKCSGGVWTLQYCPNNTVCDGNVCVDSSIQSCGASGINCKDAIDGWASGKCINDECVLTGCINGYHLDDTDSSHVVCEINSKENCGSHGNACPGDEACNEATGKCGCGANLEVCEGVCVDIQNNAQNCGECGKICQFDNGLDVGCEGGECKLKTCESGYHPFENACEKDDTTNCGEHGVACTIDNVTDSESVSCDTGVCKAVTCESHYHVYEGTCEKNDNTNCGEHGVGCTKDNVTDSATVSCDTGVCKAVTCESHYHAYEGACEKNDTTNCGEHGVGCTKDNVTGSETVSCDTGVCVPLTCDDSHTLNGTTCMENTCTEGKVICTNFGTTGKLYRCQGNSWVEQNDCENNLSCNAEGSDCGICINEDVRCLNSEGIGEVSTCRQGDWSLTKNCETTSCDKKVCGECKTGDTKCADKDGVGHIYTCEAGRWHETQSCEITACNGKVCGKLCESSNTYSNIVFPDNKQVKAFCIRSEDDLRAIRDAINAEATYPANNTDNAYILTKDLTLTETNWTGIGIRVGLENKYFTGYFYGGDHKITFSNPIIFNTSSENYAYNQGHGLFGMITDSVIMNLMVDIKFTFDSTFRDVGYMGGLAGGVENSTLLNIQVDFSVFPDSDYDPTNIECGGYVGGLTGSVKNTKVDNCSANADIKMKAVTVGGLIGNDECSVITNCHSEGTVAALQWVGGLTGYVSNLSGCKSEYMNNFSTANVKYIGDVYNFNENYSNCFGGLIGASSFAKVSGNYSLSSIVSPTAYRVGGLFGCLYSENQMENNFHIGGIKAKKYIGGVVGLTQGGSHYDITISNTFHAGEISSDAAWDSIAGVLGVHYSTSSGGTHVTTIQNCYSIYTTNLSPNYGFVGVIYDKNVSTPETTIKNLTISNGYYPSSATKPYSDVAQAGILSADLKTVEFVQESGKYVVKSGSSLLKDVLGTGWTSYSCTMDIGNGAHENIIPIHSDFVPDFCHK